MAAEPETTSAKGARRRRRSSQSKTAPERGGLIGLIRRPGFGRIMFALMLVLAAIHSFTVWREVANASGRLGLARIGMSRDELQKGFGEPATKATSAEWQFVSAGRTLAVRFDAAGRVSAISCSEAGPDSLACPDLLGVRIGADEPLVLQALGYGQVARELGQTTRTYSGLGVNVDLRDGRVAALRVSAPAPNSSLWPITLWRLLP